MTATVFSVAQLEALLDSVGNGAPVVRAEDDKGHLSFEVGLVEAGEHAEAVECLELRVKILLLVSAVRESVQTNTVLVVRGQVAKLDGVPALDDFRSTKGNDLVLERLGPDSHLLVVDLKVGDSESL